MNRWSEKWVLKSHPEKCKTIGISKSKDTPDYEYTLKEGNKTSGKDKIRERCACCDR